MITQFDKTTCKLLAREIEEALAAVATKHGLVAVPAGGTFDAAQFTAKVKFTLAQSNPAAADAERIEFSKYCEWFDLKPEHYGAKVQTSQGEITLVGFQPSRSKFPIKARAADGSIKLYTQDVVRRFLTLAAKEG
jgi:hypothetical protein